MRPVIRVLVNAPRWFLFSSSTVHLCQTQHVNEMRPTAGRTSAKVTSSVSLPYLSAICDAFCVGGSVTLPSPSSALVQYLCRSAANDCSFCTLLAPSNTWIFSSCFKE